MIKTVGAVVLGANVVFPLGAGAKPGVGVDVGWQAQGYDEHGEFIRGDFHAWAEEVPALNYGPVLHVWRAEGAWTCGVAMRVAGTWPLRVGTGGGWFPGPGLGVELGPAISTAGYVGLDGQALIEGPWVQARAGVTLAPRGLDARRDTAPDTPWRAKRLHVGAFSPLEAPWNWEGSEWKRP